MQSSDAFNLYNKIPKRQKGKLWRLLHKDENDRWNIFSDVSLYYYLYWFMGSHRFSASTQERFGLYYYGLYLIRGLIQVEEKKFHLWNHFSWECLRIYSFVWNQVKEKHIAMETFLWFLCKVFLGIIKIILAKTFFFFSPPDNKL